MRVTFILILLCATAYSDTFTFTVEGGQTVSQDSVVSVLPNGNIVEGFGDPGVSIYSTDLRYTMSCILDANNDKVVLTTDEGDILIVQGSATNVRPVEGTPFRAAAVDRGILQLECLTTTTFAILSAESTDGEDTPFIRLYTVNGLNVQAESPSYFSPITMERASTRPKYFIIPEGTSGMILLGETNVHTPEDTPMDVVHWSLNTLAVPPTAVQDGLQMNALDTDGISRTYIRSTRLDTSRVLVGMWATNQIAVSLVVLQWTGSALNSGPFLTDFSWVEFYERVIDLSLAVYDNSVAYVTTSDGRYTNVLVTGFTLTVQTLDADIFPVLPAGQRSLDGEQGKLSDTMTIRGNDVVYVGDEMTARGTVNPGAPFAITWGTPTVRESGLGKAMLTANSLMVNTRASATHFTLTPTSVVPYMYNGPAPAGVARNSATGGGSVTVTTSGSHPWSGLLVPGGTYYGNSDGTITPEEKTCCMVEGTDSKLIGMAQSTSSLFINWPNWNSRT